MWRLGGVFIALWTTVAAAEPTYVERPLLLPNGVIEGRLVGETFQTQDEFNLYRYGVLAPTLRYGLGVAEVEAGLTLQTFLTSDDDTYRPYYERETFQSVYAAGRVLLGAETSVTLRFETRTPGTAATRTYIPGAFLEHKWHPSSSTSVHAVVGGSYVRLGEDSPGSATNAMDLVAGVRGAVQLTPAVALEGRVSFEQVESDGPSDPSNSSRLGVGCIWNVASTVDLFASIERSSAEVGTMSVGAGELSRGGATFSVGVAARKIP